MNTGLGSFIAQNPATSLHNIWYEGIIFMNTFEYEVVSIDGDYANLKRIDVPSDETKLVARALLPPEITEGTKLKYEMMQYEIMN